MESKLKSKTIGLWFRFEDRIKLEAICRKEHLTKSEILGKLMTLFLNDVEFQRKVVEEIKKI